MEAVPHDVRLLLNLYAFGSGVQHFGDDFKLLVESAISRQYPTALLPHDHLVLLPRPEVEDELVVGWRLPAELHIGIGVANQTQRGGRAGLDGALQIAGKT